MSAVDPLVEDYLRRLDRAASGLPADRRSDLLDEIGEHIAAARASGAGDDEAAVRTVLDRLGEPEEIAAAASEDLAPAWGPPPPRARGTGLELAAVLMLTVGSFLPVAGWLVGVGLLWSSSLWRAREKLLGTLVVPLGPGGVLVGGALLPFRTSTVCTSTGSGFPADVPPPPPGAPAPPPDAPPFPQGVPMDPEPYVIEGTVCTSEALAGLPGWAGVAALALLFLAPVAVAVLLMRIARRRAAQVPVPTGYGPAPTSPWGPLEIAAVVLLGLGGVLFPVVPLLVGLLLACLSPQWTTGIKVLVGVLVLAGGAAVGSVYVLNGPFGFPAVAFFLLSPVVGLLAAALLAVQLQRRN